VIAGRQDPRLRELGAAPPADPQAPGGTLPPDSDRSELPSGDSEHEGAR